MATKCNVESGMSSWNRRRTLGKLQENISRKNKQTKLRNEEVTLKWSESCSAVFNTLPPRVSLVHGILQARILEQIHFLFSKGSFQPRDRTEISCIAGGFFFSLATIKFWGHLREWPISYPADLPNPGIKLGSPALQVDSLQAELPGKSEKKSFPDRELNLGLGGESPKF